MVHSRCWRVGGSFARSAFSSVGFVTLLWLGSCGATQQLEIGEGAQQSEPEVDQSSPERLHDHVEFLATLDPQRSFGNIESLDRAAKYIADSFKAAGGKASKHEFDVGGNGDTYANVHCIFGPEEGARLIVGAHYDSFGDLPGADDNASGVAVLLALAHEIADLKLARPVELVAYTLEEPPSYDTNDMGSARHVQTLTESDTPVLGMICLEMLGYYTEAENSQEYPAEGMAYFFGTTGDFLAIVGRNRDRVLVERVHASMVSESLRVQKLLAPAQVHGVDFSDHRSFWAAGFEALMITDTAFYRNPNYHEPSDTPDTLDYKRMSIAVERLRAVVVALAGPELSSTSED